ncbi:MAG: oligosaccharide flippase family protein [Bacteroidales bacterium]|nr:oligosaccharide flippase family protein [Candidatus Physcousia equi]
MLKQLLNKINSGDERSVRAKRNILVSFLNKGVAILISLAIVPITIDYLDAEQYGIWLTLSSIVAWVSFFDVGLGHGFRNRFAEARAHSDDILARKYVSTAYIALITIFGIVMIVFECLNVFIRWDIVLNVSEQSATMLQTVMSIVVVGVCTQFAMNVFPIMLSADQRPAASAIIATTGQGFALLIIALLTLLPNHSMTYLAYALSWAPVVVTILASIWMFTHKYRKFAPSFRFIDLSLIKNILSLGGKFFVIQLSMILIFQIVNIILSRVLGPTSVTEYNVTYKYFSITMMVFNIILSPYWSAFTDAHTRGDLGWMKNVYKKLIKVWMILLIVSSLLLVVSPIVYQTWLHGSVEIPFSTSISMCVYMNILGFSTMYMTLLNGTGKVLLQMIIYVAFAVLSIPCSYSLCGIWGISGVLGFLSMVYLIQCLFAHIQLNKILSQTASGVWNR